jgi:dihydroxyacetone kinase
MHTTTLGKLQVKNYSGDRIHFGLAAETAKAAGRRVALAIVDDDVAIDAPGLAGRRGIAGTLLVHKVAGAAAAGGASLEEVGVFGWRVEGVRVWWRGAHKTSHA